MGKVMFPFPFSQWTTQLLSTQEPTLSHLRALLQPPSSCVQSLLENSFPFSHSSLLFSIIAVGEAMKLIMVERLKSIALLRSYRY